MVSWRSSAPAAHANRCMKLSNPICVLNVTGKRSQEALEEIECSQALDVVQDGRYLGKCTRCCYLMAKYDVVIVASLCFLHSTGSPPFSRPSQAERVPSFDCHVEK